MLLDLYYTFTGSKDSSILFLFLKTLGIFLDDDKITTHPVGAVEL